jgi:hypothetical protein
MFHFSIIIISLSVYLDILLYSYETSAPLGLCTLENITGLHPYLGSELASRLSHTT